MYLGRGELGPIASKTAVGSSCKILSTCTNKFSSQRQLNESESIQADLSKVKIHIPPIKAVILLGGLVRPTKLSSAIGRSLLDLPTGEGVTLVNHWYEQVNALAVACGINKINVRILIDQHSPSPCLVSSSERVSMRVDPDRVSFRGTGGVLRDLAVDYDDNDYLLVGNAAQMLLEPLTDLVGRLAQRELDVVIISHSDGTPSGLALVRCGALRDISPIGFVDFKEQALPAIARSRGVGVVECNTASGVPIRTPVDYISALMAASRTIKARSFKAAEDWRMSFGIAEPGANVDPSARIHDSVVLEGAKVERGAVLVRAVVCSGATVRRGQTVVDRLVAKDHGRNGQV